MSEEFVSDDRDDKAEIRFFAPLEVIRILDGYCAGTRVDRTAAMNVILGEWARAKLHEATLVLRVHGGNATSARSDGKAGGK